jgi:hypothetical protein
MKKTLYSDILFILALALIFLPFVFSETLYIWFKQASANHAFLMGFLKFAILATMGEMLGLRIRKGVYNEAGFGLAPRAVVWGFLGVAITAAMMTFKSGAPVFAGYLFGVKNELVVAMFGNLSGLKILGAFFISVMMNCIFAPVFMVFHKITDTHIVQTSGTLKGFFTNKIDFSNILQTMNWTVQWKFVFMKTIPFFWIPAHTITFILPNEFQVLFAAILGIVLGVIMSIAANKK